MNLLNLKSYRISAVSWRLKIQLID